MITLNPIHGSLVCDSTRALNRSRFIVVSRLPDWSTRFEGGAEVATIYRSPATAISLVASAVSPKNQEIVTLGDTFTSKLREFEMKHFE